MLISYGVRKLYKKHQAKKEAEATGQPIPYEKQKLECPNCRETKKIDFITTPERVKTATCMKCGTQWRVD